MSNTEIEVVASENVHDVAPLNVHDVELVGDIDTARTNLKTLISKSDTSVDELLAVAEQSQHPRAYEVLGNFLKIKADLNKDLVAIAETKSRAKGKRNDSGPGVTNQNLFVGSTAQLAEMLKVVKK